MQFIKINYLISLIDDVSKTIIWAFETFVSKMIQYKIKLLDAVFD